MRAYGSPASVKSRKAWPTEPRYRSYRWRKLARSVVSASRSCWACSAPATCCDHIVSVYPGMPDSEFFDRRQLRGSCRKHNLMKGSAEALQRDLAAPSGPSSVITSGYSRKRGRPRMW
jgi:hypothetical protein